MNKALQNLANDLITSLKYLEKGKASTVTQEREKALQTIQKIFEMKMDLNKKIVDGIFFACLNLFAEKELIESELILLLQVLLKLFETYSGKDYFLEKANENNNNLIAFLVKLSLPYINSEAKEIASLSSLLLIEIAKYLDIQRLKNIYPSLCSVYLKVILDFNPKTSKKCLIQAVDFLLLSFEKIFSDTKYKSTKNIVSLEKKVHDLTLSLFKEPAQENKNGTDRDEDMFYQEARKILNSFFQILSEKAYKLPKSADLTQKFVDLFDFILNKCIKFFHLQEKNNFMRAFNCLLYFLALSDSETTQKHTLETLKLYPSLKYEIKSSQLKLIKDTPKLLREVETKYFISHFKRINLGFEILNTQDFITYTSTEMSDILKALQSAFHLNFKGQIIVNDSSLEVDYENLKNKALTQDYMTESFHQYNSAFTRFILEYLPVSNFDEEVFRTSRKMFSLIKGTLATNLIENLYSSLIENKFSNTEEVLTVVFLLSLLLEHSQENGIQTLSLLEFFLDNPLKNIELPKTLKAKEQKLLIDQLTTTIVYFAYQRIPAKSPILTSRVLIFLFCRFHQDHRLQRFLVWNCLIKISKASFDEVRTFEDFIKFYSETLIRNFIDKLKMIHLLYDPELPFNLLKAFIWFSDSESFLKYAENLISHLNRHFDKFYLREDFRTIKLIFPLYKAIFEAIDTEFTRSTEKAQKILKNSNLMRRALLRIKPFILENDRYLCHYTLEILKISCFALSCLPMEREQANENFSPDDPENVVISESLGPIAWEFFDTVVFRLKKKGHPATILECLQYLRTIQKYNKRFLINERRFETTIFPIIQNYLFSSKKEYYNNLDLRILEAFCLIIIELDLSDQEANKNFIAQIKSIANGAHEILEKVEDNNMNEQLKKIVVTLDKLLTK